VRLSAIEEETDLWQEEENRTVQREFLEGWPPDCPWANIKSWEERDLPSTEA